MISSVVVDRHRFGADPDADPDPTFHFDAGPDPDPTTLSFTHVGKSKNSFHSNASLYCFIFLVSVIGVIMFNIMNNIFSFLYFVEMDTCRSGSGSGKMMPIRPDPDPQHRIFV